MLIWRPSSPPVSYPAVIDDDEKSGKLRRRAKRKRHVWRILWMVGFLATVALIAVMQRDYTKQRHRKPVNIRGTASKNVKEEQQKRTNEETTDGSDKSSIRRLPENSIYRLSVTDIYGELVSLSRYIGKVTLVVNTACLWGKTQLEFHQLAVLHETLQNEGFSVLAFPTNDFHQELSNDEEIRDFWSQNFPEATFPVFRSSSLHDNTVYQLLQQHVPNQKVQHNFFKYLVGKDGLAVALYSRKDDPLSLEDVIRGLIHQR